MNKISEWTNENGEYFNFDIDKEWEKQQFMYRRFLESI